MKFFLDSANIEEIRDLASTGLVDGVTTNPSLIAKSGRNFFQVIEEICAVIDGPVSAEVAALDAETMVKEGLRLCEISRNVTVKLPLTWDGLKACKILTGDGRMVNMTLCFSPIQAMLAAKAGASFVSPFIGRLDDIGQDGMQLIADISNIYAQYPTVQTEILVASIRNPNHLLQSLQLGADVATLPPAIMRQLINHPLTDKGIEIFLKDWQGTGQKIL
jgi:transaldolase